MSSCGVVAHPPECLCDVDPSLSSNIPYRYHPTQVKYADIVRRATGWDGVSADERFVSFCEALATAAEVDAQLKEQTMEHVDRSERASLMTQLEAWLRSGGSMIDAPQALDVSFTRLLAAFTNNQPSRMYVWSEDDWAWFETELRAGRSVRSIAKHLRTDREAVARLTSMYRVPDPQRAERRAAMKRLMDTNSNITPAAMRDALLAEGFTVHLEACRTHIKRHRPQHGGC